jgi:hypothetical protein
MVMFRNMFERGNWEFVLIVGANTVSEQIDLFPVCLHFVPTHSILDFMQRANLEELGTMELMVIGIYWVICQGYYPGSCKWVGHK